MNFFCKFFSRKNKSALFSAQDLKKIKNIDSKVVVGKILKIAPHPDPAVTRVKITQTKVAPGKTLQILCGGVNISEGKCVPVAKVGAKLADFEIGERKIRGEVSRGMICSREELGLNKKNEPEHGIWLLGNSFAKFVGSSLKDLRQ